MSCIVWVESLRQAQYHSLGIQAEEWLGLCTAGLCVGPLILVKALS